MRYVPATAHSTSWQSGRILPLGAVAVGVGPAALGAADNLRVEASCLLEVPNLDGHIKWRKSHGSPPVRYRNATGSRGYQMRPCAAGASLRRRQAVHPCTAVARPCAGVPAPASLLRQRILRGGRD